MARLTTHARLRMICGRPVGITLLFLLATCGCGGQETNERGEILNEAEGETNSKPDGERQEQALSAAALGAPPGTEESLGLCLELCDEGGVCVDHQLCSPSCVENLWAADTYDCQAELNGSLECLVANHCDEEGACASRNEPWLPCFDRLVEDDIDSFPFELEFTRCARIWDRVKACDGSLMWDDSGFACDNDVTVATQNFDCMPGFRDFLDCMASHDPCEGRKACQPQRDIFESCVGYE